MAVRKELLLRESRGCSDINGGVNAYENRESVNLKFKFSFSPNKICMKMIELRKTLAFIARHGWSGVMLITFIIVTFHHSKLRPLP